MLKGLPIGIVLGAVLAFALFRAVERRQKTESSKDASAAGALAAPSPEAEALQKELDAAKARKAKLEEDAKAAEAAVAAAKSGKGPAKPLLASPDFYNPWESMAKTLFKVRENLDDVMERQEPEYKELLRAFVDGMRELAEQEGLEPQDFENSPYGPPMLMLTVLEGAEPPIDPSVLDAARAAIEKSEGDWRDLKAKKDEMTDLESRVTNASLIFDTMQQIRGLLTEEQKGWFTKSHLWTDAGNIWNQEIRAPRESMSSTLVDQWGMQLGIDGPTKTSLAPVADQFLRRYDAMEADFERREAAGEKVSEGEKTIARAKLAVEAQAELRAHVNLTPEQEKKLKAMGTSYQVIYQK